MTTTKKSNWPYSLALHFEVNSIKMPQNYVNNMSLKRGRLQIKLIYNRKCFKIKCKPHLD